MKLMQIGVTGMTCAACAARIEKSIRRMDGVQEVQVSLALARATVEYDPKRVGLQAVTCTIEKLGYGANGDFTQNGFEAEKRYYRTRFIAASALSLPLLWAMLGHIPALSGLRVPDLWMEPTFQWILATLLQFGVGYPFYYGAFQALIHRTANMDTLVAVSTSAAYFYSHYAMFRAGHSAAHSELYFDTIAMAMTTVLLGKWLESMAKGRALKELNALYALQAKLARVVRGKESAWIQPELLRKGDCVLVEGGEWIPVDGYVLSGTAEADESMLTGESKAALKLAGSRVYAGTRCLAGTLRMEADRIGEETRLSRMAALVEAAQREKPEIQRTVDRLAAVFVPFMIVCAAVAYLGWLTLPDARDTSEAAMRHAMAVLLVACPCALGLATPVSVLVATSSSMKKGVVFKDGRSLERLQRSDVVLLDKTGTLTEGEPRLAAIHAAGASGGSYTLRMAAAVAVLSSHPLARAIARSARDRGILIPEATAYGEHPGKGMEGCVEGKRVCVGSRIWLLENGVRQPAGIVSHFPSDAGHMTIYAAIDGEWAAAFVWTDKLRTDALAVVKALKRIAEVRMVTGDEERTAAAVAAAAGIDRVHAGMLPEQKLALIRELQRAGRRVTMIGDGVNDAAALAAADVGIAMGSGTDAAMQAGDVVLIGNRLSGVSAAYTLSRQTMRNIRQNLIFALLYNAAAVPLAAMGGLDPRIACIGMAASSLIVVGNALRLERLQRGAADGDIR